MGGPRDVLIDVRCLQDPAHRAAPAGQHARALLDHARAGLADDRLIGLADAGLPPLAEGALALLDAVRPTAYTGALPRPACFVQLSPLTHDPMFVAGLLEHGAIPAATAVGPEAPSPAGAAAGLRHATASYWLTRYDLRLPVPDTPPPQFWSAVRGMTRPRAAPAALRGKPARVAILTPLPGPLCAALARRLELHVFTPGAAPGTRGMAALALAAPQFDRVLAAVANTGAHAGVVEHVARYGGAVLLRDACLLAAYRADRVTALAEAELGRPLASQEYGHWTLGEHRLQALLLGELAGAAEPLIVHSAGLAAEVDRRYGRPALTAPMPIDVAWTGPAERRAARDRLGVPEGEALLAAFTGRGMAEGCIWALEWLRFWGVPARLALVGAVPADWPRLRALALRLGVADRVALMPQGLAGTVLEAADAGLYLAMRGHGSFGGALAAGAGRGLPCIASESVAESLNPPGWVQRLPDQPSPVLLAEAVADLLDRPRPERGAVLAYLEAHAPDLCARRVCQALGLG